MNARCPFCGRPIVVGETTTAKQREAGLVYLLTRCVHCNVRIDAAGVGREEAERDLTDRLRKREGTTPDQWRIKVRPERGRRRRR